jgi:hypothetical protein
MRIIMPSNSVNISLAQDRGTQFAARHPLAAPAPAASPLSCGLKAAPLRRKT